MPVGVQWGQGALAPLPRTVGCMAATPTVMQDTDGLLIINWPDPRPRTFEISAEAFEELIDMVNMQRGATLPHPS